MENLFWQLPLFFIIAVVYSSIGMGGASAYLAVLYLGGITLTSIPPIALFLNIIATAIALYRFHKEKLIKVTLVLLFASGSIPAAFFSAQLNVHDKFLSLIFASLLLTASMKILFAKNDIKAKLSLDLKKYWWLCIFIGIVLGFFAGMVGIGGGIFLAPVLLIMDLTRTRETAAACALFIFLNSVSGVASHAIKGNMDLNTVLLFAIPALLGSLVGSYLGIKKLSAMVMQKIFALVLLYVSLRLFLKFFDIF